MQLGSYLFGMLSSKVYEKKILLATGDISIYLILMKICALLGHMSMTLLRNAKVPKNSGGISDRYLDCWNCDCY